jgi:hypothetical protein
MRVDLTSQEIEELLTAAQERILRLQAQENHGKVEILDTARKKLQAASGEKSKSK